MGFKEPLPAPSPIVQVTIAAMPQEVHEYIQRTDLHTIESTPEDGEPLLLLHVLDLGHWTRVFELANADPPAAVARLADAAQKLADLNQRDALEMSEAKVNTSRVEEYLKSTNFAGKQSANVEHKPPSDSTAAHPFVIYMRIPEAHKQRWRTCESLFQPRRVKGNVRRCHVAQKTLRFHSCRPVQSRS